VQQLDDKELALQLRNPNGPKALYVSEWMAKANDKLYKEFAKKFSPKPHASILEIGPANGAHISTILSCGREMNYTSIDLSDEMVEAALKINASFVSEGKVKITQGNCRKMKFDSSFFDYVIGINTVYFWDPLENYLDEIRRVLKPTGNLILGFRSKSGMLELPFSRHGFSLYEAPELEAVLYKSGFKTVSSWSFPEEINTPDGRKLRLDAVFTLASSL